MRTPRALAAAALCGLLTCAGCQKVPAGPLPLSITPAQGAAGASTAVVVRGEHFNCNNACRCEVNCGGASTCTGTINCLPGCTKTGAPGCSACDTC